MATILERGRAAAAGLPEGLVHAGFSLGVLPAQLLAQTRPGARGAVLMEPASHRPSRRLARRRARAGPRDGGRPVLRRRGRPRRGAGARGDRRRGRRAVTCPGAGPLFADAGLPSYDEDAARLLTDRVLDFLDRVG